MHPDSHPQTLCSGFWSHAVAASSCRGCFLVDNSACTHARLSINSLPGLPRLLPVSQSVRVEEEAVESAVFVGWLLVVVIVTLLAAQVALLKGGCKHVTR